MTSPPPPRLPGILLGIGTGGLVDGIVLHQLLQWHHVVSHRESPTTVAGLELNTLADGAFHVLALLAVLAGLALLWRRVDGRARTAPGQAGLWGWVLVGYGAFNLVEGVVNHHLLQLHHVRDDIGGPLVWDIGFLLLGVAAVVGGWLLQRSAHGTSRSG